MCASANNGVDATAKRFIVGGGEGGRGDRKWGSGDGIDVGEGG